MRRAVDHVVIWPAKDDAERKKMVEFMKARLGPKDNDLVDALLMLAGACEQLPYLARVLAPMLSKIASEEELRPNWESRLRDELIAAHRWLEGMSHAMFKAQSALFRRVVREQNLKVIGANMVDTGTTTPAPEPPEVAPPYAPKTPEPKVEVPVTTVATFLESVEERRADDQRRIAGRVQGLLDLSPTERRE